MNAVKLEMHAQAPFCSPCSVCSVLAKNIDHTGIKSDNLGEWHLIYCIVCIYFL